MRCGTAPGIIKGLRAAWRRLPAACLMLACVMGTARIARSAPPADAAAPPRPHRVVSLDYCADAHLVAVASPEQILALSAEADAPYAWTRGRYQRIARLPRKSEAVLRLKPELAVTTAGAEQTARLLERTGVRVLRLGYLADLDASFAALDRLGTALGRSAQAAAVAAQIRARMARLEARAGRRRHRPSAVYLTPSGLSTGAGTYIDRLMHLAGLENALARKGMTGWYHLRLRDYLGLRQVEVVVASFFDSRRGHRETWRVTAHPLARAWLAERHVIEIPARLWGCAGFYTVAAAERIAAALSYTRTRAPAESASQVPAAHRGEER